jgi:hypothetical protein
LASGSLCAYLYSGATALIVSALALMLPLWSGTPTDIRMLAAQLSILVLVGAGIAIITSTLDAENSVSGNGESP